MAIAQMAKVMIVTHRTQASDLLEALQSEGICQILNAEEAAISRDFPELSAAAERPRDIENQLNRLTKAITFLKTYAEPSKGIASILAPRTVIDLKLYKEVIGQSTDLLAIVGQCEQIEAALEKAYTERENLHGILDMLGPWATLETPVEEIGWLKKTTCLAGLLPLQQLEQAEENISELGGVIQQIATTMNSYACLVVCLNENVGDVQKLLRSAEFEPVNFESMKGTVAQLIEQYTKEFDRTINQLQDQHDKASQLSKNLLNLRILHDHYENLLNREQAKSTAPATEQTVILEGWVKTHNYTQLEKTVAGFEASSLNKIEPAEDEEIPVEIENKNYVRPFEVITRLYGMPKYFNIDPTVFLAPFFALFFALCFTDAGYGLIMIAIVIYIMKKMQGDKKIMHMLMFCSFLTLVAGALTGGWFGDTIQQFIPPLKPLRAKMMWFDPFEKPMTFFILSLVLGYTQIIFGISIAFVHKLRRKEYASAIFDHLTWLVMLNSIAIFGLSKVGLISPLLSKIFGPLALVPALAIVLFSNREGGWANRIGMGAYNLFTAIFYLGDILSYVRLMALGMVTAGLAMAINVIAKITLDIPYIGFFITIVILAGGHLFNIAMSLISGFVHTLRLQFVEFFPKFFIGGGKLFEPLDKKYQHIYIEK